MADAKTVALKVNQPPRSRKWNPAIAASAVACLYAFVNYHLISAAGEWGGWGAFGIAFMFGPIINGVLAIITLGLCPLVKHVALGNSISTYVASCIGLPLLAIIGDWVYIFYVVQPHGC